MLPVRRCDLYHPHAGIAIESLQKTGWRLPFNLRRKAFADVERELLAGGGARTVVLCCPIMSSGTTQALPRPPVKSPCDALQRSGPAPVRAGGAGC